VSASVGSVLVPAGLDNAVGVISTQYLRIRPILSG